MRLVVLSGIFLLSCVAHAQNSVTLQVYYEALCPDSQRWMKRQLDPTYETLKEYLQVDFYPFGKADWEVSDEGDVSFTCQHGPRECTGNLYQACLLDKLDDNEKEVDAVTCIMDATFPDVATESCMASEGITSPTYEEVDRCEKGSEGEQLLISLGEATKATGLNWVPWVTINGVYIEEDFDATQSDLFNLLCTKYLQGVPECE